MHAAILIREESLEDESLEVAASDRPTLPVPAPKGSGIRLFVRKVAYGMARVDAVVCDRSRDPRSEDFAPPTTSDPPPERESKRLRLFDWDSLEFVEEAWAAEAHTPVPPSDSEIRMTAKKQR